MKPLIVGENPSTTGNGKPFSGQSGRRLMELLGYDNYKVLQEKFHLENLCEARYSKVRARDRALSLRDHHYELLSNQDPKAAKHFILCGVKVQEAFGIPQLKPFSCRLYGGERGLWLWAFPHPSGLNRFWNDATDTYKASMFLRALAIGRVPRPSGPFAYRS